MHKIYLLQYDWRRNSRSDFVTVGFELTEQAASDWVKLKRFQEPNWAHRYEVIQQRMEY